MTCPPSRRTFLRLSCVPVVASAGCLGVLNTADIQDLRLANETGRAITVTTTVTRVSDGESVFTDTTGIQDDGDHSYRNPIREAGLFEIGTAVEDGLENTYEWDAPADEAYGLIVHLLPDEIGFSETVV